MQEVALFMLLTVLLISKITIIRLVVANQNKETLKVLMNDWGTNEVYNREPIQAQKSSKQHTVLRELTEHPKNRI